MSVYKEEKIENVTLDLSFYKGEDAYSDGESVEDAILDIVKSGEDIEKRLSAGSDWASLYHLWDVRKNILSWADIPKGASALEIGSGCGAVTGVLCEKCEKVTCVDLSKKRSTINAYRNKIYDNLRIIVGNFEDVEFTEKYDVVTLIGVFEYSIYYISSDNPFIDMLKKCRSLLKEGGRLYIAIENKYGMKYFAGATEDHTGKAYDGIEGYHGVERVRTFSRDALDKLLAEAGFSRTEFRYPVPDYKLPMEVFSDKKLPSPGDITLRAPNYDRARCDAFDEVKAFNEVCSDELFPVFANSFAVTAFNGSAEPEKCIYAKFNTLRDKKYRVDTRICEENGKRYVVKSPACTEAIGHIDRIEKNKALAERCFKTIKTIPLARKGNDIYFDYLTGTAFDADSVDYSSASLEEIRDDIIAHLDILMKDISDECRCDFEMTDEFREIFGDISFDETCQGEGVGERDKTKIPGLKNINLDMIFGNFINTPDGLICIDYEWFADFPIPEGFIKHRIARCIFESYSNISTKIKTRQEFSVFIGTDERYVDLFDKMEDHFQKKITGDAVGVDELNNYRKPYLLLSDVIADKEAADKKVSELEEKNAGLEKIVNDQQAHIEKMKKAIKNPLFGIKWAAKKITKK